MASYSAPLVLLGILLVWGLAWLLLHPRGARAVRRTPAWDCGFGPLNTRMQYTGTAFAMPLRRIFAPVWRIDEKVERQTDADGLHVQRVSHQLQINDHAWSAFYEPIGRFVLLGARGIARLQQGNIRLYLAYSFFTLLVLLWLIA